MPESLSGRALATPKLPGKDLLARYYSEIFVALPQKVVPQPFFPRK